MYRGSSSTSHWLASRGRSAVPPPPCSAGQAAYRSFPGKAVESNINRLPATDGQKVCWDEHGTTPTATYVSPLVVLEGGPNRNRLNLRVFCGLRTGLLYSPIYERAG
jgi:hypothetical protein